MHAQPQFGTGMVQEEKKECNPWTPLVFADQNQAITSIKKEKSFLKDTFSAHNIMQEAKLQLGFPSCIAPM